MREKWKKYKNNDILNKKITKNSEHIMKKILKNSEPDYDKNTKK